MKHVYEIWGLGYDSNGFATAEDYCYGSYDSRDHAVERFNELNEEDLLDESEHTDFRLEDCVLINKISTCVEIVKELWW